MGPQQFQGTERIGKHHRMGDHHLVLDHAVDQPRLKTVDFEDRDTGRKPILDMLVIVLPPAATAMAGNDAGDCLLGRLWVFVQSGRLFGQEQMTEDDLFGSLLQLAEEVMNLKCIHRWEIDSSSWRVAEVVGDCHESRLMVTGHLLCYLGWFILPMEYTVVFPMVERFLWVKLVAKNDSISSVTPTLSGG